MTFPYLYLASSSSQRSRILKSMWVSFQIIHPCVEEFKPEKNKAKECVLKNSELKVEKAFSTVPLSDYGAIVSCDTLVSCGEDVFCKPANEKEAFEMWACYRQKNLSVLTAVSVMTPQGHLVSDVEQTDLYFRSYRKDLEHFFQKILYAPYSSGGFTIEGCGALFFDQIRGSYYNVLGLPVHLMVSLLDKVGVKIEDYIKKG